MARSLLGVLIGSVLVIAVAAGQGVPQPTVGGPGPFAPYPNAGGALIAHVAAGESGPQLVTVIDTQRRVMAVYQVDRSSGEITLKSVRNLTWDLEMMAYNSGEPLPQNIRDMRNELQR